MMIESALALTSVPDVQLWLIVAVLALRLATAGINLAVTIHRSVRHLRKKAE